MTPERLQQIRRLFEAALEQQPERRAEFLEGANADDAELREEVRRMLEARDRSPEFLEQPAAMVDTEAINGAGHGSRVFAPGITVAGRFEILDLLGRGGMGEVYHARDHKLHRSVALKVIAAGRAGTLDRKRRFLQEARAASALNHPSIATVYDIAEEDGVEYIAMEYVAGKSMDNVIPPECLKVEDALKYAVQIADALAAAHAAGVVHRDVKPGNIIIAANGGVKVLDFGLAKLAEPVGGLEALTTNSEVTTAEGVIVGTVSYMSPEQTEGKPVDARSDIFSFGCVLYEMFTGRRPFEGESKISTLAAILQKEPARIRELAPAVPAEVERAVMRCLRKDPAQRFQTMADVKVALERSMEAHSPGHHSVWRRPVGVGRRWVWGSVLSALTVAAVGLATTLWMGTTHSESAVTIKRISPLTSTGTSRKAAISPDGRYVAYVLGSPGRQSLRVRQVNATADITIVPIAEVSYLGLTFAPDGTHVFYGVIENTTRASALYRVATLGGPSEVVTRHLDSPIAFSPSGQEFAFVRENASEGKSRLIVAAASAGRERSVAERSLPEYFDYPSWSPDGDRIAVSIVGANDAAHLATVDLNEGNRLDIVTHGWRRISGIGWFRSGFIVSGRAPDEALLHLWHVAANGTRRRLTPDLSDYWGLSITDNAKTLVAVQERSFSNLWRVPVADVQKGRQLVEGVTRYSRFGLMADGRLLFEEQAGEIRRLVISDGRGGSKPLTATGRSDIGTVCPDNRTILYTLRNSGPPTLWKMGIDGSGPAAIGPETNTTDIECTADSKWAIYTAPGAGKYSTLWKVNLQGGRPVQLTTKPSEHPALSPDGRQIAFFYVDEQAETHQRSPDVAIISVEGGRIRKVLPLPATVFKPAGIKWTPDGKAITYVTTHEGTATIWARSISGGEPKQILRFPREQIYSFDWAPDGDDLYVSRGPSVFDVVIMSVGQV